MMINNKEQAKINGYGYFRKSKAYGLVCGIGLAGALFISAGTASAEEVTTSTSTPASAVIASSAEITTVPASDALTSAVSQATDAGVPVTQEATQTVASNADAQSDYANQAAAISEVTTQQEAINAENAQTATNNEALVTAQENAKAAAEATNKAVEEAQKTYPNAKATETTVDYGDGTSADAYKVGQAKAEEIGQTNSTAITDYSTKKAEVDAHNAETKAKEEALKKNNIGADEANGVYVTGNFDTAATGLDYYKTIKVISVSSDAKAAKVLGWQDNTVLTDPKGVTVTAHDTANDPAITGTTSNFLYKITDTTVGDSFVLKNIGTTTDGTNINALVTIARASALTDTSDSHFLIGKTADGGISVDYWNYDNLSLTFAFKDDNNNDLKLVVASVVGDVDGGQTSNIVFKDNSLNYINPDGSGLTANANKSLTSGGFFVDGYQNAPLGTYLMVGSSTEVTYTHTSDENVIDTNGNIVNYIQFDLFGTTSMVETQELTYLPDPELNLQTVTLPPEAVETPLKENLSTTYHLNQYIETPAPAPTYQAPATPQAPAQTLPQTGDETNSVVSAIGGAMLAVLAMVGLGFKRQKQQD